MNKYFLWIASCVAVSFVAGLGWGYSKRQRMETPPLVKGVSLRVLCADNWLSSQALAAFSKAHRIHIEQWTYASPSEFLHQMANADGQIDVICTSSFLIRSLISNHWIQKMNFQSLPNAQLISVDFTHLPFDPESEYSLPLYWNLYGLFGKSEPEKALTWKQVWAGHKVSLWGNELNLLQVMQHLGFQTEPSGEEGNPHAPKISLEDEVRRFAKGVAQVIPPDTKSFSAESALAHSEWVQLPLSHVARLLESSSPYHFWLPEDGGAVEVGVFAVGSKAEHVELALALIDDLLSTDHALESHTRIEGSVVHTSLSHVGSIASLQKPQALRRFQLNRLRFPDLNVEDLARFQKVFDQSHKD